MEVNLFGVGEGKKQKAKGEKERKGKASSELGVIYGVRYFFLPDGIRPLYEGNLLLPVLIH